MSSHKLNTHPEVSSRAWLAISIRAESQQPGLPAAEHSHARTRRALKARPGSSPDQKLPFDTSHLVTFEEWHMGARRVVAAWGLLSVLDRGERVVGDGADRGDGVVAVAGT